MSGDHRTVGGLLEAGVSALPKDLAGHIAAGAGDGNTTSENTKALERVRLVPAVATGVGSPTTATKFLGLDLELPAITAPMGPLELIDPGGARSVAEAAARCGVATTVALTSAPVLEEAIVDGSAAFFQLYWWGDHDWIESMAHRANAAGYAAIVVTVDVPDYGTRWVDVHSGFDHHGQMALPNLVDAPPERSQRIAFQRSLTFDEIDWLCGLSALPIVVKGVLSATDASKAVEAGASAVYVSNHGGRALAGEISTVDALEDVVAAIDGSVPIVVDGGFRTAEDIVRGLALGADLVAVGRGVAYALAAGGVDGVVTYLSLLKDDLHTALTVLGARDPNELNKSHIRRF